MKINISQQLKDLKGRSIIQDAAPFQECPKCGAKTNSPVFVCQKCGHQAEGPVMTLADLCYNACTIVLKDSSSNKNQKLQLVKLAKKFISDEKEIDLTAEDISLIKNRVDQVYNSQLMYYLADSLLEGRQP